MAKAEEIRANLEKELNLKALNNSKSNNNSSDILDRKSTRLNSSHRSQSRMPSSA